MKKITLIVLMLFTVLSYAQGIELNGTVSAENNQIKNVADPTEAQDAVTKNYTYSKAEVDALIANLQSQIDDDVDDCISDIAGMYSVTTTYGSHDFLPQFDSNTQEMEIIELGEGSYSIADFTGGLHSNGPYAGNYGTIAIYAEIIENCGIISWNNQSDPWGDMIPNPGLTNSISEDGVITINWLCETYGEYGQSVYTPL